MKKIKKKSS